MGLKDNLQRLTKQVDDLRKQLGMGPAGAFEATNKGIKQAQKEIKVLQGEVDDLNDEFSGTRSILDGIAESLGKKVNFTKEAVKQYNKLGSIAQDISNQENLGLRLSDKKLENKQAEATAALREIKNQAKALVNSEKIRGILKDNSITQEELLGLSRDEGKSLMKKLSGIKSLSQEEKELITARAVGFTEEKKALGLIDDQIARRKNANKSLGLAGALTKSLSSVGGEVAKAFNLDQITEDMQEFADANATANSRASKLAVLGEGIKSAFRNLGEGLSDPLVLFNFLLGAANKTSQRITDIQNQIGASYGEASRLNVEMQMTAAASGDLFITTEKLGKSFATVTDEIGMSAEILGMDTLVTVTKLTNELGMSGKEATNLAVMARLQGKDTEAVLKSTVGVVENIKNQNKASINTKKILNDVANVSSDIAARLGRNPELIAEAATEADLLGLSLDQVNKIAESLLNFETSIENELKAELITGKELNLEKARELALTGDLAGLSKEIGKQDAIRDAFASKNVIAQKSIADSLGLSVSELADMSLKQDMLAMSAEKFKETYGEQAYNSMMAKSAQEKFNATLDKVKAILGGIGTALAPILDGLVFILDNPIAPYLISAFIVMKAMKAMKLGSMFGDMAKGAKNTLASVKELTKASKFYKGGQFMPGGERAPKGGKFGGGIGATIKNKLLGKGGEETKKAADQTKGIKADQGKGIKGFLQGLGDGLASIGSQAGKVIKGGVALGIALVALGGGFALAGMFIQNTDPTQMIAFSVGLSMIGLTVAVMGKMGGSIIKGALALGILAIGLIPAAFAFSLLAGVDAGSILAFAIALPILGLAVLGLGLIFSNPFTIFLFGAGIAGLLALGLAIIPLATAFSSLADANIEGIMETLMGLASVAPQLVGIGVGLASIAAGLAAISIAGLLAMPTLMALTALGSVSEGLGSIFGGGGATDEDDPMIQKLNEVNQNILKLISVVEAGGDIIMDGAVVGKQVSMASSRIG